MVKVCHKPLDGFLRNSPELYLDGPKWRFWMYHSFKNGVCIICGERKENEYLSVYENISQQLYKVLDKLRDRGV